MRTMTHNATHLLLVTIFTVILSCLCAIDQETEKQDEKLQLSHLTSEGEGASLPMDSEKRASAFMPGRGRKSLYDVPFSSSSLTSSSLLDLDTKRAPSSAFYGARGKKLILYPFFDYTWKRAHMIPMRGRKDSPLMSLESLVTRGASDRTGAWGSSSYQPDDGGWKRSLFYGSRGKKDQQQQQQPYAMGDEQVHVPESGYSSFAWPELNAVEDEKRAGFYGSRG